MTWQMFLVRAAAAVALAASVGACVGTKMLVPDSRLASQTAGVLGVAPEAVTISNRRGAGTNTYYTATVGDRTYACILNGGSVMTFGMVNPPMCNPVSAPGAGAD